MNAVVTVVPSEVVPIPGEAEKVGSATADISARPITEVDKFILLCSDGVWEFISSEDAVQQVAKFKTSDVMPAAEHLASLAWQSWMREMDGQVVDDITVLIVWL